MAASLLEGGWNVATLKAYVDQRFTDTEKAVSAALDAAEKAVAAALASSEKATEKAEKNAQDWRSQANEWRGSMTDREFRFASKDEMTAEFKAIRAEIAGLRESRAEVMGGKASWAAMFAGGVVLIGLILAALRLYK